MQSLIRRSMKSLPILVPNMCMSEVSLEVMVLMTTREQRFAQDVEHLLQMHQHHHGLSAVLAVLPTISHCHHKAVIELHHLQTCPVLDDWLKEVLHQVPAEDGDLPVQLPQHV